MGAPCCLLGASTLPRPPERICASEGMSVSVDNKSAVHYKMQYNVHNKCEKKMKGQKKCLKDSTPSWVRLLSVLVLCLGIITPAYEAAPSGTPCDLVTGDASARAGAAAQVLEAEVATSPPGRNIYSAALTVRRVLRRYRGPGRLKKQDVITLTLQREEVEPCLAVASLEVGKRYFVFMNAPERKGVAPKAVAAPLPYSKRARRLIRQETCSKCAARRVKPPTVVSRLPATDSAVRGHSVNFTCVFEGMPLPSVQWYKDGVPITLEDINSNDVSSSPINTNSMRIHTRRVRSRRVIRRRRRRRRRSGSHLLPLIGSPTAHNDGSEMGLPVRHSYGRQKPYLRSSLTNTNRFNEESTTDFEINSSHGSRNRLHLRPPVSTLQQLHETDNGADDVIRHSRSRSRHRHRGPSHRTRNRHNLRRGDEHHRRVSDSNTLSHNPGDSDIGNRNVGFSQGLPTTTTTTTSTPSTTTPSRRKKHRKKKNRNRTLELSNDIRQSVPVDNNISDDQLLSNLPTNGYTNNASEILGNRGRGYIRVGDRRHDPRVGNNVHPSFPDGIRSSLKPNYKHLHNDHQHPTPLYPLQDSNETQQSTQTSMNTAVRPVAGGRDNQPYGIQVPRRNTIHRQRQHMLNQGTIGRPRIRVNSSMTASEHIRHNRPLRPLHNKSPPHSNRTRARLRPQSGGNAPPQPRPSVSLANRSKSGRGIRRMVSSLSIGVVENDHAGEYKCVATSGNFTAEQQIALKVIPPLEPGIIYPCPMDSFCLNGGTCMYFRFVGELVCQCVEGFKGHRCQEKEVFPTYTVDNRCRGPYSNAQSSQGVRCPRNQPLALWQLLQLSLARRQFHSKILPWRNTHLIDWSNSAPPEPYLVPGMTQPQYSLQVQRNRRLLRAILALDVGDLHPFDMQSQSMETEPSSGSLAPHTRRSGQLESYIPENLQDATTYKKEKQQFFQQSSDSKLQSEEDAFPNIFVRIGHHHSNEGNARNYSDIQKNVEHITRGMIWNTEHSSLYPSEHHREHDRLNQPHRIRHSHLHDGSEQRTWSDHVYDDIEDQRSLVDDYSDMLNDGEDSEQN